MTYPHQNLSTDTAGFLRSRFWKLLCQLWFVFAIGIASPVAAQTVKDAEPTVVFIEIFVQLPDPNTGQPRNTKVGEGSGFIIHPSGWVITAAHVVDIEVPPGGKVLFEGSVRSRHAEKHPLEKVPGAQVTSDVALLRFPPGLGIDFPFLCVVKHPTFENGDQIKGLGFPLGWDLSVRPGAITSTGAAGSLVQSNMILAPGMSGGPVLNQNGHVIGIVRGGLSGQPGFDVFVPVNLALPLFDTPPASYAGSPECPTQTPTQQITAIERAYPISETNDSHSGLSSSSRPYRIVIEADPGHVITNAELIKQSATRVSDLTVTIAPDKKSVELKFRLTAGPTFDRYRGWLHGQLVLTMIPEGE